MEKKNVVYHYFNFTCGKPTHGEVIAHSHLWEVGARL